LSNFLSNLNQILFGPNGLNTSGSLVKSSTSWIIRRVIAVFLLGELLPGMVLGILHEAGIIIVSTTMLVSIQPVAVVAVIWLMRPPGDTSFGDLLPIDIDWRTFIRHTVVWGVLLRVVSTIIVLFQTVLGFWEDITNNPLLMAEEPLSALEITIIVFSAVILVPIAEELFYRGLLYRVLGRHFSFLSAMLISTIVWTVLHGSPILYPPIFALGIILVMLYESTETLWAPIAAHIGFNLTSFIFLWIMPNMV